MKDLLPPWRSSYHGTIFVDLFPVKLTASGVHVNLAQLQPTLSFPEVSDDPEKNDDGECEIGLEEALNSTESWLAGRANGNIELLHG